MRSLEEIRTVFLEDRFATVNGAMIEEVGEGYARCSMVITPEHRNAVGAVMGGASFTLADFAFAVAANHEQMRTVSLNSSISFLGTVKGTRLIAEARCVKNGRSTCYYTVSLSDELGNSVAEVAVNGFHKG